MTIAILALLGCLLVIFVPVALVMFDLSKRDASQNETLVWAGFSLLCPVIGPICYLFFRGRLEFD